MCATRINAKPGQDAHLRRVRQCAERIRDEFLEMADMALSHAQACRLWSADSIFVGPALRRLVAERFLVLKNGRYMRSD